MPRIRSVHPGRTTDEDYVELSFAAMVATDHIGCHADDNGVFEWKPKTLKMRIFPAANVEMDAILEEMVSHRQIRRFEVDGRTYGAIRNFLLYQRPQKPKQVHPLPPEIAEYVGATHRKSPTEPPPEPHGSENGPGPVADRSENDVAPGEPHSPTAPVAVTDQYDTGRGIAPQREEVRGKREEKSSDSSLRSESAAPSAAAPPPSASRPPDIPDLSKLAPADGDWKQLLFAQGLAWLASASGRKPPSLRSLVGGWRRDLGEDDRTLFGLFAECQKLGKIGPVEWLTKAVKRRQGETAADADGFGAPPPETWSRSDWISAFEAYAETNHWPKHWRAPPDDDACKAPADLIERWRNGWRKAG